MGSNYPSALDSFTTKVDNEDDIMAAHINDLQDAIEALQAKLGIDGSSVDSSVDYKLGKVRSGERAVEVGDAKMILGATPGPGWLLMNGNTIGDSSSGGTSRANSDCSELFAYIWTNLSDTVAPIYTSAGVLSTKGASAAADFAAHKRITIPTMEEYVPGGYKSGSVEFGSLGGASPVGEKTHRLTGAESGEKGHTHTDSGHTHPLSTQHNDQDGSGSNGWTDGSSNTGAGYANIQPVPASDASNSHNNIQPTRMFNFVIKF